MTIYTLRLFGRVVASLEINHDTPAAEPTGPATAITGGSTHDFERVIDYSDDAEERFGFRG